MKATLGLSMKTALSIRFVAISGMARHLCNDWVRACLCCCDCIPPGHVRLSRVIAPRGVDGLAGRSGQWPELRGAATVKAISASDPTVGLDCPLRDPVGVSGYEKRSLDLVTMLVTIRRTETRKTGEVFTFGSELRKRVLFWALRTG
jgi:hypothetical protein